MLVLWPLEAGSESLPVLPRRRVLQLSAARVAVAVSGDASDYGALHAAILAWLEHYAPVEARLAVPLLLEP